MIIPDINLLVFAYNGAARQHARARKWWEEALSGDEVIGMPWAVTSGFIRLMTHRQVLEVPLAVDACCELVEEWFAVPNVQPIEPGPRHLGIFRSFLKGLGTGGDMVTDAHLAALAVEHSCELHSNDSDFSRFSGLRWVNPLR